MSYMKSIKMVVLALLMVVLTGCAQKNVALNEAYWSKPKQTTAVVAAKAPTPQLYQMGNEGILEYAVNSAINAPIDRRLEKTDLSWYQQLPNDFSKRLAEHHIHAAVVAALKGDKVDVKSIAAQNNSDNVLVLKLQALGVRRNYFSVVPTGAPVGYCVMEGELINAATNKVLWRHQAIVTEPIQGEWDQAPNYPNLSNAVALASNSAKSEIMDSFFSGQ